MSTLISHMKIDVRPGHGNVPTVPGNDASADFAVEQVQTRGTDGADLGEGPLTDGSGDITMEQAVYRYFVVDNIHRLIPIALALVRA